MTLPLFDQQVAENATPPKSTKKEPSPPPPFSSLTFVETLVHPFPRYGLAIALAFFSDGKKLELLTEQELREMLAQAIESGLNWFRMETGDKPDVDETLHFYNISLERLQADTTLVQKAGLSAQGKYLFPSVVTTDGGAKNTFEESMKIVLNLRDPKIPLTRTQEMKRSFAPMAGEINNGSKEKTNEKGSLFEAACAASATVAREKPAALSEGSNTAIFPDLDLPHLIQFIKVFRLLQAEGASRMEGKPSKKKEFRRPPLHDGNYPDAPREAAFGAVSLLAALGYWATRAEDTTRRETQAVLDSLAGAPLYVVSYDGVQQAQFSHHVVGLAKAGRLRNILNDFYRDTRTYAEYDASFLSQSAPSVRHMFFAFSRFLQRFDAPSFRDFISTRAEYPPSIDLLLGVYFMEQKAIPRPVVESARALGQWINRTAYFVAEEDTDKNANERNKAIRKAKAKVLVEFESAVMSAESPADMLHRVSTRAGRLLQDDAPAAATTYFDAAAADEIPFKTAQHLLIAYLRLRSVKTPTITPDGVVENAEAVADPNGYAENDVEPETA